MTAQRRARPPEIDGRGSGRGKPHDRAERDHLIFTTLACLQAGKTWQKVFESCLSPGKQRDSTWAGVAPSVTDTGDTLPAEGTRGAPCSACGDEGDRAASQGSLLLAGFRLDVLIRLES